MQTGREVGFQKSAEFDPAGGWRDGDAGVTGQEAELALVGVVALFLGAGSFSTAATTRL